MEPRFVAWNRLTGLFFSAGKGFVAEKAQATILDGVELLVVRYQWENVEYGRC